IRALAEEKESIQKDRLSTLARMEKEDEIVDWLNDNGFPEERQAAETFSEFGFSIGDLEKIRVDAAGNSFSGLLRWLENTLTSGRLIKDLEEASGRISNLVGAIKSHVHMDRVNDVQRTSIHTDIENTLTL